MSKIFLRFGHWDLKFLRRLMFNLTGKVALVTGASSGIGRASAIALASQGASVAIAARRVEKLEELKKEIESKGGKALVVPMDVTIKEQVEAGVKKTVETFGRLDILLNNAGVAEFVSFFDMTDDQWDKTLNTNLKAYFHTAQAAGREMAKNKWGRIINIASIASGGVAVGFPQIAQYCASKGGVVGMTEALADELAPMGITVNAIGPGIIETEMTKGITSDPAQSQGMLARIPLKRFGKPEEIAAAVVYLASDEASYTTGATLYIDGGWTAS